MSSFKKWLQNFNPREKRRFFMYSGVIYGGIVGFYYYFTGSKDFAVATISNCFWMLVIFTIIVAVYRKDKGDGFWKDYLIGALIYCGAATAGVLIGVISTILLAIVVALALISGVFLPSLFGPGAKGTGLGNVGDDNGNPGFQHNCCYTCSRYSYGQCLANPGQPVSDPGSTVCGSFMLK
ncbi:MAG: hypothetical protein IJC16_10645 [Rikenellaceae bacterium]|nr:hypothetical protein [Rikenellaceae bacterium]